MREEIREVSYADDLIGRYSLILKRTIAKMDKISKDINSENSLSKDELSEKDMKKIEEISRIKECIQKCIDEI